MKLLSNSAGSWRISGIRLTTIEFFNSRNEGSKLNRSHNIYWDDSIKFHPYFNAVRKKNIINLTKIIGAIDKLIEKVFYDNLPFKYSKGYNNFLKNHKQKDG